MRSAPVLVALLSFVTVVAAGSEAKGPNRHFQPAATGLSPVSQLLDAATLANAGRAAPDLLVASVPDAPVFAETPLLGSTAEAPLRLDVPLLPPSRGPPSHG